MRECGVGDTVYVVCRTHSRGCVRVCVDPQVFYYLFFIFFFFLRIRRPPRSTQSRSSAASDVYKRQIRGTARSAAVPEDVSPDKVLIKNMAIRLNQQTVMAVTELPQIAVCRISHSPFFFY